MAFLTLSDGSTTLTVPVRSNAAGQEYQEHGADRFRVFSGEYRMTRRAIFRHWSLTSKYQDDASYLALVALLKSSTLPLTATGDLMDGESVKVMPNLKSASPTQTATGFVRTVTFELDETLNTDVATITPWLFLRSGSGYWHDTDKTVPAGVDDTVHLWADASGNGRDVTLRSGYGDDLAPLVQLSGTAIRFGDPSRALSGRGAFSLPSLASFTEGEIMIALRRKATPADDSESAIFQLGAEGEGGDDFPRASDGHVHSQFGTDHDGGYDCGAPGIDLTGRMHVINAASSNAVWFYQLDGVDLYRTTTSLEPMFDQEDPVLGENVAGGHFNGWVKHVVIFSSVLTAAQRASWYAFMNGDTDDPPFEL